MEIKIPFIQDSQLPSFEQIKTAFQEIDLINGKDVSYEERKRIFFEKLTILPQLICPEGKLNLPIYRTSIIDLTKLDIRNPDTFSHPPANLCDIGRCNLKGNPVFYGSILEDTAIREKRKANNQALEEGDEIYISQWEVDKAAAFKYSQFIFESNIALGEMVSGLNEVNVEKLATMSTPYTENKQNAFKHLVHKLGSYFLSDDYNLSSFLSHYLLFDGRESAPIKADAIIYPSIQSKLNNFNLAIHPEFVKSHMKLVAIKKIRLKSIETEGCRCELLETGFLKEDGLIHWITPVILTENIQLSGIEILFENEPSQESYNSEHVFKVNGVQKPLEQISWDYINENKKEILDILSQLVSFDYNTTYQKEFYLHPSKHELCLELENEKYFISTLKINVDYRLAFPSIAS